MVREEDFHAGRPGSNPPRHIGNFFSFKIQETCLLTTFVEQKQEKMRGQRGAFRALAGICRFH